MRTFIHLASQKFKFIAATSVCVFVASTAFAFEGRITATLTQGGQTTPLLYTVGTNFLRIEITATNWPNPVDIMDRNSSELTLLFRHNRSFVRLKPASENISSPMPGVAMMPNGASTMPQPAAGLPPGVGPTNLSAMPPRAQMPAMPAPGGRLSVPAMPMMPVPPMEKLELKATGETTNLLGYACARYELKQRGETMQIWATDRLFPYQAYVRRQPHRFGPRMIEEQWPAMLNSKKLFPLLATLKFENGTERLRMEVKSIKAEKIENQDGFLFQPPPDYQEVQPLPF